MKKLIRMKTLTAAAIAAVGLGNVTTAGWLMAGAVVGAGMVATPAMASAGIPGVGVIIKKKPGNAPIIAPTDANGVIRLSGLEAGEYEVSLIGEGRGTMVNVGRNGMLTTRAVAEDNGSNRRVEAIGPGNSTSRVMTGGGQKEEVGGLRGGGFFVAILAATRDPDSYIDVNRSSAGDIVRLAPTTSAEAAAFIVAERAKGGAFKDPIDFAQRVCPTVSVDLNLAPTRIGNTLIIARGTDPVKFGFKCASQRSGGEAVLELYGRKHSYVGHVTLLR